MSNNKKIDELYLKLNELNLEYAVMISRMKREEMAKEIRKINEEIQELLKDD